MKYVNRTINEYKLIKYNDNYQELVDELIKKEKEVYNAVKYMPYITNDESEEQSYMIMKDDKLLGAMILIEEETKVNLKLRTLSKYKNIEKDLTIMMYNYLSDNYDKDIEIDSDRNKRREFHKRNFFRNNRKESRRKF